MSTTHQHSLFHAAKSIILLIIVFLFPLFFLPTTQEFFMTNKLYLLAYGILVLVAVSGIEFVTSRKFVWVRGVFDSVVALFLFTVALSILLTSPNKVQALLNVHLGLVAMGGLGLLYYYLSRTNKAVATQVMNILSLASLVLALLSIVFFFNPLKSTALPSSLEFLKNPNFTPLGSSFDLLLFLGFFAVVQLVSIFSKKRSDNPSRTARELLPSLASLTLLVLAILTNGYAIVKTGLVLPPLTVSWYAAVETLKQPMTALFGVGVDNFSSIFSRSKDMLYNQSPLWQIQSFNASRSAFLHIFTETGVFGFIAFILLVSALVREAMERGKKQGQMVKNLLPVLYIVSALLVFPPSMTLFFLLFVLLGVKSASEVDEHEHVFAVDMRRVVPVYIGGSITALIVVGGLAYFMTRAYVAEYSFKRAIVGVAEKNIKQLYDNQRNAVILNPYIERYRLNFSQTNLLIANNISQSAQQKAKENPPKETQNAKEQQQPQLSEQDRQTISQAVQAAIAEAKAAASLNPMRAGNWENLANVYRSILGLVQEADAWTISSFQRAIMLDPQNPTYRLNLGGVYFSMKNFDEATKMFEQAVSLKPDWSNSHYNLAWSYYQKQDYPKAVAEMQSVLSLTDPKRDEADYKKANQELEEMKKKLPKEEEKAQSTQSAEPKQLKLSTPQTATVEPKLQLPKEASPEK